MWTLGNRCVMELWSSFALAPASVCWISSLRMIACLIQTVRELFEGQRLAFLQHLLWNNNSKGSYSSRRALCRNILVTMLHIVLSWGRQKKEHKTFGLEEFSFYGCGNLWFPNLGSCMPVGSLIRWGPLRWQAIYPVKGSRAFANCQDLEQPVAFLLFVFSFKPILIPL